MSLRRSPGRRVRIGTRSNRRRKPQPEKNEQDTSCNSLHKLPLKQTVAEVYSAMDSKPITRLGDHMALPCAGDRDAHEAPPFR
jgi:hypothetical protein